MKAGSDAVPKGDNMKEIWTKSWKRVLIWACGYVSLIAFAIAGGYAIVKGEDAQIKQTAKNCFIVTLIFLAADALVSILSHISGLASSVGFSTALRWINFLLFLAKTAVYATVIIMILVAAKNEGTSEEKKEAPAEKEEDAAPEKEEAEE